MSIPFDDIYRNEMISDVKTINIREYTYAQRTELPFKIRSFRLRDRPLDPKKYFKDIITLNERFTESGDLASLYNNKDIDEEFRDHIDLFILKLYLWEEIPIDKSMSKEEIFFRSLNEQAVFTDYLKDLRFYSMKNKVGHTDILEEIDFMDVEGYDSLFREGDLLFWDNRQNIDDFQWAFTESVFSEKVYEDLGNELDRLLQDTLKFVHVPSETEILLAISNSSSFLQGTTVFQELNYHLEEIDISQEEMYGRRLTLSVKPGSDRDTVIPDLSTLYKLKHDSMLMSQILELQPESAMCTPRRLKGRMKMLSEEGWFAMIDFKKCGLTTPHRLLKMIGDKLDSLNIKNFYNHHQNTKVLDEDGSVKKVTSGFCLGWANEIPTIGYILASRYIKRKYNIWHRALFFNDDSVIKPSSQSLEMAILTKNVFSTVLTQMGFLMNEKKSIISRANIFCEIYNQTDKENFDGRKRQALTSACACAISTNSYTISREYMSTITLYSDATTQSIEIIARELFAERMKHFLYFSLPYSFGGITPYKENFLNADMLYLERKGSKEEISAAISFLKLFRHFKKPTTLDLRNPNVRNKKVIDRRPLKQKDEGLLKVFQPDKIKDEIRSLRIIAQSELTRYDLNIPERLREIQEQMGDYLSNFLTDLYNDVCTDERTGIG